MGCVTSHVLVVDDDDDFRGLAARMIAAFDIGDVAQAGTFAAALDAAERLRPVAALVDVGLPDGDGVALAARLAATSWRPRVVLTSSDSTAATRADGIPFIAKEDLAGRVLRDLLSGNQE
jgi:DNA-binding response OmpR family regulator